MSRALSYAPFGLALKGSVETFQQLVKNWQERDGEFQDINSLLSLGGEDWLLNSLVTHPTSGISPSSLDDRIRLFGSNVRQKMEAPCKPRSSSVVGTLL